MATEKRLIDRNEIFPNGVFFANAEDPLKSLDELIARIWSIHTVDAVEVVRCKDCDYRIFDDVCQEYYCNSAYGINGAIEDNSFCSYGERRNDGKTN